MTKTWQFREDEGRLISGSRIADVTPKAAAILSYLLKNKGRIVSRQELLDAVWPDLHVTPDLVREYIHDLRSALGDNAKAPRYIETLRGRGVRLNGGVVRSRPGRARTSDPGIAVRAGPVRATVAVLGPQVESDETRQVAFAKSVCDEIIGEIARYEDVDVVARALSFAVDPRQDLRLAAAELGAGYLLESSFSAWENRMQARFRLIDGRGGTVAWSKRFEGSLDKAADLSEHIMTGVVNAIIGWQGAIHRTEYKIVSRRDAGTLSAFEHFIKACDLDLKLDAASVRRSLMHFNRSLEQDDRYARCWMLKGAMLRWAFDVLPEADPSMLDEADAAIDRAAALDPGDPTILAFVAMRRARAGDWAGAEQAARIAEATGGSDADACIATATPLALVCGDMAAAQGVLDRAFEVNPVPPGYYRMVETRVAYIIGEHERAIAASRQGTRHPMTLAFRAMAEARLGQADAARESWAQVRAGYPRFNLPLYADVFPVSHPAARVEFDAGIAALETVGLAVA